MSEHPIPVVVISSLTSKATETGLKAIEYGAVEIVTKPQMNTKEFFEESRIRICDVVKAAAIAKLKRKVKIQEFHVEPKYTADAVLPGGGRKSMLKTSSYVPLTDCGVFENIVVTFWGKSET